jgi:7,8-dihydropterin-6-yl-methyl-4-(beta-D-ribofuranosyl)aminobenzene 5'-phosphate synthase
VVCSKLRIRIVVDNQAGAGLVEEHGFAVWIEADGHMVLFDTGQGAALMANLASLGCALGAIDAVVLSHGHYDHSGALSQVIPLAANAHVYCHAGAFVPRFSLRPGEPPRAIAVAPADREAVQDLPSERLHWINGPCRIVPGVHLTGPIPRLHPLEDTGGPFYLDQAGRQADPLDDDLALWLETGEGLIILTGCCHAGLINTVEQIRAVSGSDRVRGIIGGLHLLNASGERLAATCAALREWHPDFVLPCHCTGIEAVAALRRDLGERVVPGRAGCELIVNGHQTIITPLTGKERP